MNPEKINDYLSGKVKEKRIGGAALLITQNNKEIYNRTYGSYLPQSIYRIYSMSKIITAIAAMMLAEEQKLALDAPVKNFYPGFGKWKVYQKNGMPGEAENVLTVQHLLNMTSGISYPLEGVSATGSGWIEFEREIRKKAAMGEAYSTQKICGEMCGVPASFEPGTSWQYGASADLLGGIIEKVSGYPLDVFLKNNIFEPLGMSDTDFYIPAEKLDRLAVMYTVNDKKQVKPKKTEILREQDNLFFTLPDTGKVRTVKPLFLSGGAGLYSTTADYQKILTMLLNGGKYGDVRILRADTVRFMITDQLSETLRRKIYEDKVAGCNIRGYGYSNFLRIMQEPLEAVDNGAVGNRGEFGWDGLPGNYCLVDPVDRITLLFMIQVSEGADLEVRADLRKMLYEK